MMRSLSALLVLGILFSVCVPFACGEEELWREAVVAHCEEWVSLRAAPDTASERLAQLPLGTRVEAHPYDARFVACRYQDMEGYVLAEYIEFALQDSMDMNDMQIVVPNVRDDLTLRERPDTSSKSLAKLRPGERMRVLGWDGAFCRVQVVSSQMTGWVNAGYIMAEDMTCDRWPYDYAALMEDVDGLRGRADCIVEMLGVSADGREIPVVRIGSVDAAHHVLIQAGMHAREIMTGRLAMDLTLQWIEEASKGYDEVCVHIVPMVNPDGVEIAVHGPEAIRDTALREAIEKTLRSEHLSSADWKANARLVDLNRNFDAGWEKLSGRTPGSQRYRGETPVSEPESRALVDYVDRYPFEATISLHSRGSLIYWYGAEGSLQEVNRSFVTAISGATGYPPVTSESNVEKGGFKDWALEKMGIPSVTIEIGCRESAGSPEEYSAILLRCRTLYSTAADWVLGAGNR